MRQCVDVGCSLLLPPAPKQHQTAYLETRTMFRSLSIAGLTSMSEFPSSKQNAEILPAPEGVSTCARDTARRGP
jgi:hypothetical protein